MENHGYIQININGTAPLFSLARESSWYRPKLFQAQASGTAFQSLPGQLKGGEPAWNTAQNGSKWGNSTYTAARETWRNTMMTYDKKWWRDQTLWDEGMVKALQNTWSMRPVWVAEPANHLSTANKSVSQRTKVRNGLHMFTFHR